MIFGVVVFAGSIMSVFGPILTGRIFDVTNSYNLAFLAIAAISLLSIILTALLRPTQSIASSIVKE